MMNDEFLHDLQTTWQAQEHDTASVLRRLRRKRWSPYLALTAEAAGCIIALFFGGWFIKTATSTPQHALLFTLSAAVMLIIPAFFVLSVIQRRASFAWHDETPQSLLRSGIRRVETSLRVLLLVRWHMLAIAVFVALLWACQALGFIHAAGFMVFYTAICLIACTTCWLWMGWRRRRLHLERDCYVQLLVKMEVSEDDDTDC